MHSQQATGDDAVTTKTHSQRNLDHASRAFPTIDFVPSHSPFSLGKSDIVEIFDKIRENNIKRELIGVTFVKRSNKYLPNFSNQVNPAGNGRARSWRNNVNAILQPLTLSASVVDILLTMKRSFMSNPSLFGSYFQ